MNLNSNCFEVRLGLIAFLLAATVGTVLNMAYGTLMEHKGEFYCYDETTTTKKDVLKEKDRNSLDETIYQNAVLGNFAEDNPELAETICQNMVAEGQFPRDNQPETIELEGTLTLEFDWDD
jgi:hypothetical protein